MTMARQSAGTNSDSASLMLVVLTRALNLSFAGDES